MVSKVGYHSYTDDTRVEISRTNRDQVELAGRVRVTAELAGEHNHMTVQLAGELTGVMVELAGELTGVMVELAGGV
ncbi:hypothetical protein F2Q69_00051785 [Brassica cretica]|uniref:Uncharacterized protein n=1 Tax=Brassica cretica TaxID=69181 RepID=A0A8S9Q4Z6_BRACR|nr:hypothetical protein F2Q69_00051785 [Brassica cretica]